MKPDNDQSQDPLEMLKKAWEALGIPFSLSQGLDQDEIEKRISELRIVEQWLSLNLTILQNSIQALKMQKETVNTFQQFNNPDTPDQSNSSNASQQEATRKESEKSSANQPESWWQMLQQQFNQISSAAISSMLNPGSKNHFEAPEKSKHEPSGTTADTKSKARDSRRADKTQ